jgi:hypothetical protein
MDLKDLAPSLDIVRVLPEENAKVCPHLPPIPLPKQNIVTKQMEGYYLYLSACMGSNCAKYEQCQGKSSPDAVLIQYQKRSLIVSGIVKLFSVVPMLSDFRDELTECASRLREVAFPPVPKAPETPENPGPNPA